MSGLTLDTTGIKSPAGHRPGRGAHPKSGNNQDENQDNQAPDAGSREASTAERCASIRAQLNHQEADLLRGSDVPRPDVDRG